jgi:hypothetical protein
MIFLRTQGVRGAPETLFIINPIIRLITIITIIDQQR